jgi:DAACS family dicarboxylate/amino acid:cation (Na+ or H+) symporter
MRAWLIAAALVLGAATGLALGSRAVVLGEIAVVIIQVLKTLAAPLVFLAVTEACSRTAIRWVQGVRLLTISLTNAAVAGAIAIGLDRVVPTARQANVALRVALLSKAGTAEPPKSIDLSLTGVLEGLVPKSVVQPFIDNQVIGAVALALFFGLALRKAKDLAEGEALQQLHTVDSVVSGALRVVMTGIGWVIAAVPLAVFGVIAKVVGQTGFSSARSLAYFLAIICAGFIVQGVVYYSALLRIFGRISPRAFYRNAVEALLTAMGTGSSLATLPVTLRTLQDKMLVRPENARLAAMVGTNLNHDGILLYEAATALFVARVLDIPLGLEQQVLVVGISALAAFGIGGIPEAGLITLSLVLSTLKLSPAVTAAAVSLFTTLDWLIGRMRAMLNVTSDLVVANLLEAWDRRGPAAVAPSEVPARKSA